MEGQDILFYSANTWVKVFAWLQIVLCSILMAVVTDILTALLGPRSRGDFLNGSASTASNFDEASGPLLALVWLGFGLLMGIILLQGAKERNARKLRWWLIYAIFAMALGIVVLAMGVGVGGNPVTMWFRFMTMIATGAFGIWVVWVHINEIERVQSQSITAELPPAYDDQFKYDTLPTPTPV